MNDAELVREVIQYLRDMPGPDITPDAIADRLTALADRLETHALVPMGEHKSAQDFIAAVMADFPDNFGMGGFDLQEVALKHGLLVPEQRTTFCNDGDPEKWCNCAEYHDDPDGGFECSRFAPWVRAMLAASEAK